MKNSYKVKVFMLFGALTSLLSGLNTLNAQNVLVNGKVTDYETGEGIPGVTVLGMSSSGIGAVTDIDGAYSLNLPADITVLKFSYVGYISQEVEIGNRSNIDVVMQLDMQELNEVVVTALGISRKKESLGYAVTEVDGDELARVKTINAVNGLSGKVAGVDISQPNTGAGGSSKVIIRGNSKISGTNQPLYVIDGVPMDNSNFGEASEWGGQDLGDGISSVNPDDIASISVLKGPAAAALYGSRAGNGVVMITTKKWKKGDSNKFGIDYSTYFTAEQVVGQYGDVQKVYGQGINTPPRDQGEATGMWSWGKKLDPNLGFVQFDGQIRDYGIKPDNINSFFRTGTTLQNSIAFSGGNEISNFRFSASDMRMQDIVPNSDLRRNTFSVTGSTKMWDRFTVESKITYTHEDVDNRPYLGYSGANVALPLMQLPMNFDQQWLKESKVDASDKYVYWNSDSRIINPYFSLYNMENNSDRNRVQGYLSLTYDLTKWLNLRVKSGGDTYSYKYYNYSPLSTPLQEAGEMGELNSRTTEVNSEFLLTASKEKGDFDGSISIGGNARKYETYLTNVLGRGEVARGVVSINNYSDFTITKLNPRGAVNSLYAFANIGYKMFAFLDVTARKDWDSTLPESNNSVLYPSFTGSFVFTSAFDIESKLLSYGKLRASYAEVGNGTDPYGLERSFYSYPYTQSGATFSTESGSVIPNPDLVAALTKGYEFGLDLRLLNYRASLDLTYYNQSTFNEIVQLPISLASGGRSYQLINAGEINNQGWEAMLNVTPVQTDNIEWEATFNYSRNRNSIVKLHPDATTQEIARASWISSFIRAEEGGSYGDIVGYDFKRSPDGQPLMDENGLPIKSDEQVVLGNGQFDWIGGITNRITYKGVTLKAHIDIKYGADLLSMTNLKLHQIGRHINTIEGREGWALSENERLSQGTAISEWEATGGYLAKGVVAVPLVDDQGANVLDEEGNQIINYEKNSVYVNPVDYYSRLANSAILTPYVYDASYAKLREVSLSYALPPSVLKSLGFVKGATVSFVARNVFTIWSNVPNIDPESTYSISNGQGYEYGSLPQRRSLGFNLNFKF
ncbi:MAG: SusC/RagA family TonB-linked outer membrane protein [Cyclobacteriaceae bacterium]